MSKKTLIGLVIGIVFLAAGCSGLDQDSSSPSKTSPVKADSATGADVETSGAQLESSVQILPAE